MSAAGGPGGGGGGGGGGGAHPANNINPAAKGSIVALMFFIGDVCLLIITTLHLNIASFDGFATEIVTNNFSILMRPRPCSWSGNLLKKENKRNAPQRHQAKQTKIIHERPQVRLRVQRLIKDAIRLRRRGHRIPLPREGMLRRAQLLSKSRVR